MREDWTGFYGPAYRLMLEYADNESLPDTPWCRAVNMHQENPLGEGHWEFLALGNLHLFDRDKSLSAKEISRLSALLKHFNFDHHATNWRLMAQIVRRRIEGGHLSARDLRKVALVQQDDGFLQDTCGDPSSQYHAFLLFLIMRFSDPADGVMRSYAIRGLDWLVACHQRYGDPSPLGRGRFQLFGYAAMAAAAAEGERWQISMSEIWHADVWTRLKGASLCGAISPVWDGPHRRHLLHGYNTVEDYPAFAALLTHGLLPPRLEAEQHDGAALWWHPLDRSGSGLVADRTGARVSILVSPSLEPDAGRRSLLRKLVRGENSTHLRPDRLGGEHPLLCKHSQFYEDDGVLHFSWKLGDEAAAGSNLYVWSYLPILSFVATGSVEHSRVRWEQPDGRVWFGLSVWATRAGTMQLRWALQ